jgi:hypothetical protein
LYSRKLRPFRFNPPPVEAGDFSVIQLKDKVPVLVDDAEYVLQYLMNMSLAGSKIDIDTISITKVKSET